ncbi:hypothetical protein H1R17_00545 [Flavobacterium sp. xlx-214]|uniref:HYC_CC_PP family protein n=1 Tax=unclassified Flavobacterium TaxID=196869 RepID=UPI0013D1B7C3|nr:MULTISPECIES: hypothetical protein [unclassified Flavobacterium]MBA5791160.1 hypothetical protein [Flavobacterium sp. xlx-221]QMI83670.1 hypothetical protein H1R17_00545 [Flavobacterium sp. xlx-214]
MKKLLLIFLSLFYLGIASGFTRYSHMCKSMGSTSYSFSSAESSNRDKPCPICSLKEKGLKESKKDCCKHEAKLIKVDDSVKKHSDFDLSVKFWGDAIPNKMLGSVFDYVALEPAFLTNTFYSSSKVPVQGNPLYILHCVYRI